MTFQQAISTCFSKYVDFSGRARRSEFWNFVLLQFAVMLAASILDNVIGTYPLLYGVAALALLLPGLAVTVRRLHDTGRSGWFYLLVFIPIVGAILLIVWAVSDSKPDNQYGPNPKGAGAAMH